ncbi:lysoplasmalogenase [Leifsonia sp. YAF41]|uniref:lysoplasmalogenase n=1 Tax=Leifsonia sp. YAF41 TaxID=3233086 RepID=UPI003F96EC8F
MSRSTLLRVVPFSPFLVAGILHLIGQLAGNEALITATKPLLIPSLALALVWSVGGRLTAPVVGALIALFFGWLGDLALMIDGSLWFLAGLGAFLLAHVAYIVLFLRHLGRGRLPRSALLYLVWFALLGVLLWPHLGTMLVPALIYSVVITTMAIVATRCAPIVAAGATLFLLSDSMLAVDRFVPDVGIWQAGFLIMLTYLAAQCLIIVGVVNFVRARAEWRA